MTNTIIQAALLDYAKRMQAALLNHDGGLARVELPDGTSLTVELCEDRIFFFGALPLQEFQYDVAATLLRIVDFEQGWPVRLLASFDIAAQRPVLIASVANERLSYSDVTRAFETLAHASQRWKTELACGGHRSAGLLL